MTYSETNMLLLERMEKFQILAPGSARAIGEAAKARKQDGMEPVDFIGELVTHLLSGDRVERIGGDDEAGIEAIAIKRPGGSRHLTEETARAIGRGGALHVAKTILAPLLARGSEAEIDRRFGHAEALEPQAAATALARGLLNEPDSRELISADFRPEIPIAQHRVREVLGEFYRQGTRFSVDLDSLAREWASIGTHPKRDLASIICTRLANHESHRLARGSEAPEFDPRDSAWSENGDRREETREEFDPRRDLMRNSVYSCM